MTFSVSKNLTLTTTGKKTKNTNISQNNSIFISSICFKYNGLCNYSCSTHGKSM